SVYLVCFFFQAEDGIRDFHVTGVQTCALPISASDSTTRSQAPLVKLNTPSSVRYGNQIAAVSISRLARSRERTAARSGGPPPTRSEERRVGKEGRARRAPGHGQKTAATRARRE